MGMDIQPGGPSRTCRWSCARNTGRDQARSGAKTRRQEVDPSHENVDTISLVVFVCHGGFVDFCVDCYW